MGLFAAGVRATVGYDVIGANVSHAPANAPLASYVTGSGPVPAPASFWQDHPSAVRIDQTPTGGPWDATADVDDYENGAVELEELAGRARARIAAFKAGVRPGQRTPLVYASASNLTSVVDALIHGGVDSGVGLWVANWSFTEAQALADVVNASGPFPIEVFQFNSGEFYDTDIFSESWLAAVSGHPAGSYPHLTVAGDTLGSLAAARSMDVFSWLAEQQRLSGPQAEHLVKHSAPEVGSTWRSLTP